jgi:erythronate-4-phosphate dehydrogenase
MLPGRQITARDLQNADALLVRSITKVDAQLLAGSALTFVGSATIGTDHIDLPQLAERSITFANAPGCNAQAVAEYVLSALLVMIDEHRFNPQNDKIGIVGFGNVGKRLAALLDIVQWPYLINDPPLQAQGFQHPKMVDKAQILRCKVISLHTPLTEQGSWATKHWIGQNELTALHQQIIINSCRGPVIDNQALTEWLKKDDENCAVLDVWEHEPIVDPSLLTLVRLATPHIAGYSLEGKTNGSFMVYEAFCRHFNFTPNSAALQLQAINYGAELPQEKHARIATLLRAYYDIRNDDIRLRHALSQSQDRAATFDELRKKYPERRECGSQQLAALLGNS